MAGLALPGINQEHADYLSSWLHVLREDKRAIFKAAAQAQKAHDWIMEKYAFTSLSGRAKLPDVTLRSLRVGERLSIISEDIIKAADNGESYETLVRQLKTLHHNLDHLKDACCHALHKHGFYSQDGDRHAN